MVDKDAIRREIKHLRLWVEDLNKIIKATNERGNALEKGFPLFLLVKNKLEIEVRITTLIKEL